VCLGLGKKKKSSSEKKEKTKSKSTEMLKKGKDNWKETFWGGENPKLYQNSNSKGGDGAEGERKQRAGRGGRKKMGIQYVRSDEGLKSGRGGVKIRKVILTSSEENREELFGGKAVLKKRGIRKSRMGRVKNNKTGKKREKKPPPL